MTHAWLPLGGVDGMDLDGVDSGEGRADGGGTTVWVNLAHVRRIELSGAGCGLLWCGGDLWEIADPAALRAVRRWVRGHALPVGDAMDGDTMDGDNRNGGGPER